MTHDALCFRTAAQHAADIRARRCSAVELVTAYLQRIEALNPTLNALAQIAPETALAQAREADRRLAAGERVGPLHGVPFTVKDVYEVAESAGLVTAPGMPEPLHPKAQRDSPAIRRMRAAGAILLGITRASLWSDRDQHYGHVRNPYGLDLEVSGSSGGEAVAIAAGLSPLGLGSDSGGSLRIPAHYCGVATLRPSNGRVPRGTDAAGSNDPRTAAGPLARSVEDLELALRAIEGSDPGDPTTLPLAPCPPMPAGLAGLRAALFTDNGLIPADADTARVVVDAGLALQRAGVDVEEAALPDLQEAWRITLEYWRWCGEEGAVADYFRFLERWDRYRALAAAFLSRFDLILCPVEAVPAYRRDAGGPDPSFSYTTPFSLIGWPCGVVRGGATAEGVPIGVQIAARPLRDEIALAAMRRVETALNGWQAPSVLADPAPPAA